MNGNLDCPYDYCNAHYDGDACYCTIYHKTNNYSDQICSKEKYAFLYNNEYKILIDGNKAIKIRINKNNVNAIVWIPRSIIDLTLNELRIPIWFAKQKQILKHFMQYK